MTEPKTTRTMVKKRLLNGEACDKCVQAEQMLQRRGLWEQIDQVVWAEEGNDESEGMKLAAQYDVKVAPFFIVSQEGKETIYTSALKFIREQFPNVPKASAAKQELPADLTALEKEYATHPPQEILKWGLTHFGNDCAIAFSGAEDVVLIDMAAKLGLDFSVFCLDTGRLHAETYKFLETVRKHYGISMQLMSPDATALETFVAEKGLFSFYEDGHKECCGVRKVAPLRRALKGYRAWVTGQRRDQSPSTRNDLLVIHQDDAFEGREGSLTKLNPLTHWTSQQVWGYIRANDVPYNPLHEKGFISIGCEPCTRPTLPGEHERAGRWWWEESTKRECGLHVAEDNSNETRASS